MKKREVEQRVLGAFGALLHWVKHGEGRKEWLYILAGRGTAEIDGEDFEVGPGDFMGFRTPSVAHHLRNSGEEELVYLMGGDTLGMEVATFPKLGRKMVRAGDQVEIYDIADSRPFGPEP